MYKDVYTYGWLTYHRDFFWYYLGQICIIFGANLVVQKMVPELYLLMVLFGTNLVSNISKHQSTIFNAKSTLFGANKVREYNAHFVLSENRIYFQIFERKLVEIIVS